MAATQVTQQVRLANMNRPVRACTRSQARQIMRELKRLGLTADDLVAPSGRNGISGFTEQQAALVLSALRSMVPGVRLATKGQIGVIDSQRRRLDWRPEYLAEVLLKKLGAPCVWPMTQAMARRAVNMLRRLPHHGVRQSTINIAVRGGTSAHHDTADLEGEPIDIVRDARAAVTEVVFALNIDCDGGELLAEMG